jgi:hypothetical protein
MSRPANETRREFLQRTAMATAAASLATVLPAHVLGREGNVPPSERITLGVIGFGPRSTYNLNAMLQLSDVRCVAVGGEHGRVRLRADSLRRADVIWVVVGQKNV